jgi:hypothetical protein
MKDILQYFIEQTITDISLYAKTTDLQTSLPPLGADIQSLETWKKKFLKFQCHRDSFKASFQDLKGEQMASMGKSVEKFIVKISALLGKDHS